MANLLWLEGSACSGNTMAFLTADQPDVIDLLTQYGVKLCWHPSLSLEMGDSVKKILRDFIDGHEPLDILVIEGAIAQGPNGTGKYDVFCERPFKDWVADLSKVARFVIAAGDCSCFGGIPAADPNPTDATGLQFHRKDKGGFLGANYRSASGLPVINVSGCPAHPDWITQTIIGALTRPQDLLLDEYHRPLDLYSTTTHQGCTRNEYFEYKIAAETLGCKEGCLSVNFGCQGHYTHSSCNRILWNRQSSKTRAGVPCFGCTEPDFPTFNYFKTEKVGMIPKKSPLGVPTLPYIAAAAVSKLAAPERLKGKMIKGRE
ncbi:hydrogenase [Aneurinibacillus uraniidurans]|uniref:NADH-quinone oxidoreductase subunit B family protein n=1 Tax=Aneurinibacillus uraniidurans TaxID=2966586 RepID=UPI00234B4D13|nr:hydrogenase [Aneurinibacillus sp. B1]WCN37440.1 hydrogenase [Aneurinibacillus sp. B1]